MAIIHIHIVSDTSEESINDVLKGFALQAAQAQEREREAEELTGGAGPILNQGNQASEKAEAPDQPVGTAITAPASEYPSANEVYEFLDSDDRYEYRTMKAIVEHFKRKYSEDAVRRAVEGMANNYSLETATRPRDGVRLYATM